MWRSARESQTGLRLPVGRSDRTRQADGESLAFSPDARLLAAGWDDTVVRVWDSRDGRLLRELRGHGGAVRCLAWSPDGRLLASGSDDTTVLVWDVAGLAESAEGAE